MEGNLMRENTNTPLVSVLMAVYNCSETLEEAVDLAKEITKKGTNCVLSPAAASYTQFKNYADKGDKFKAFVYSKKQSN